MSEDLNEVRLRGNLGADPELRMTAGGQAVLKLRIATHESFTKDGRQEKRTAWHRVVAWGRLAEDLGRLLMKGSRVTVEGRLSTSSYTNREGQKVWTTEIVARKIDAEGSNAPPEERERSSSGYGQRGGRQRQPDPDPFNGQFDDEIPF